MRPAGAGAAVRSPPRPSVARPVSGARPTGGDPGTVTKARDASPARGPSPVSPPRLALERIPTVVVDDHADIARLVAGRIATVIRERNAAGEAAVLGLATGSTPIGVYRELIRMHRDEG